MAFLRPSENMNKSEAAVRVKHLRGLLILFYFALWFCFLVWWKQGGFLTASSLFRSFGPFEKFMAATPMALVLIATITLPLVLLLHLFSLLVMGLMFRMRLPVWSIYLVTPLLGPVLALGFLYLCIP